jgi:hypothetical protein
MFCDAAAAIMAETPTGAKSAISAHKTRFEPLDDIIKRY